MKRICIKTFCITSGMVLIVMTCGALSQTYGETTVSEFVPGSCTIFTASYGEKVLFGNNEDYSNPRTYYWVHPSTDENYGGVYFGFDNFWPQGGINEKGLCYDWNALPEASLNNHPELPSFMAGKLEYGRWILNKCATVEEAIELVKSYSLISLAAQIHLADATGDAVVISAGPGGEFAFSRKQKGDGFLVSTNFNLANPDNAYSHPCRRYDTAFKMLEKIEDGNNLTVDYFQSILDAVHFEGASTNTLYSNIFDLRNGIIYLYHWHQWDEVVTLDVAKQITKGPLRNRISSLFSQETVDKALAESRAYNLKTNVGWKGTGWIWPVVVVLFGIFGLMVYYFWHRQTQNFVVQENILDGQEID